MKKTFLFLSLFGALSFSATAQNSKKHTPTKKAATKTQTTKAKTTNTDANVTVQTVIDKYIVAIGGEAAVKNVKTLAVYSKGSIQGQDLELNTKSSSEGKLAVDMVMPAANMTVMKQRITPAGGYVEVQGNRKDLTADELKNQQYQAQPFFELGFTNNPNVTYVGIEKINDVEAYVLKTPKAKIFYDVKTGLRVAMETDAGQKTTIHFLDYKEVKGVKIPHKQTVISMMPIEFMVSEIKINEGVIDADFQ